MLTVPFNLPRWIPLQLMAIQQYLFSTVRELWPSLEENWKGYSCKA